MRNVRRAISAAILAALLVIVLPASAQACSQDEVAYFDGFLDTSCLETLSGTTLDTFGGVRLTTNGVPVSTIWDTDTDFDTGIESESIRFAPVGARTLATDAGALILPTTLLPLTPESSPVLSPTPSTVLDGDNVNDPSVIKEGATYVMYYATTAEDGSGPAIFQATSTDGKVWTKTGTTPVLEGTDEAFDEHGVSGPNVIFDPSDTSAPYKMWYSGTGEVFGAIGFATSTDGIEWTKFDDVATAEPADPVLEHGPAGSPDSFAAADPSVLKEGSTYKMWYTGDDSNKRRIAFATSPDGIAWTKGGKVISPEDQGTNANIEFGAFAPTVWKAGDAFQMLFSGRKIVSGSTFQTKLLSASSKDGISWGGFGVGLNPSGADTNFDFSNLDSPFVLVDPGAATPFKLYYAGNTLDDNGNGHDRIGLAESTNGSNFSKSFSATPPEAKGAVLDIGAPATNFDARQASGLSVAAPAGADPKFVGFYWGNRGSDFKPRLGETTSTDGSAWTKVAGTLGDGGSLLPLGNNAAFDNGGQRDPSVLYDGDTYDLYFTALSSAGVPSIGFSSTAELSATTHQPDNSAWTGAAQKLKGDNSGFDATSVSHPSVIKTGAGSYVMYYTGTANGVSKIGRATATSASGTWTRSADPVLDLGATGSFDATAVKDPVVFQTTEGAPFRMLYTGVETLEGEQIERVGYATSDDGIIWTKRGVALNPSQVPFGADEVGVESTGALVDGSTLHVWTTGVDRTGRTRGNHATTSFPTPATAIAGIPNGSTTYQLGDDRTSARDFRDIVRTSSGDTVTLWMAFEQPYSKAGSEFWSDYFPVTLEEPEEALNILLSVRGVRWQARLEDPLGNPTLDKVEIHHAPVQFLSTGSVTTKTISPPVGVTIGSWQSLTVSSSLFSPAGSGSGTGTANVLTADGTQTLASRPLSNNGDTTIDLTGISAQSNPSLRLRLDLTSDSPFSATPLVTSLKVLYSTAPPPPPPPPPPLPPPPPPVQCQGKVATVVGTPGANVLKGTRKADVIAALGGNDRVSGLGGNDRVCGGGGRDRIDGGAGTDRLVGQAGRDSLVGGLGRKDLCNGGGGIDTAARSCETKRQIP